MRLSRTVCVVLLCLAWQVSAARPNIILILADDLGYGDLGAYGQQRIRTPNLDELAVDGMRFTDFYAGATVCMPSRASLLTGRHTGHSGVRGNPRWTASGEAVDLKPEDITIAEVLKSAGYDTAVIGKWGLAERDDPELLAMPNQQGFDYFYGYRRHKDAHYPYWDALYRNNEVEPVPGNEPLSNHGQYVHDLLTEDALRYVAEHDGKRPFFLYLAYTIPHKPLSVPDDSKAPYENLGWPVRKQNTRGHYRNDPEGNTAYAGMVSRMDRDIGRLVALLKSKGIDDDTLVVFTSDNGHEYGDGFFDSNGPLRGKKRDLYEGGIRVPTIAWWPGTVAQGTDASHAGAFWDFMPTFCELSGAAACPENDGVSLLPTLTGEGEQADHDYLYWEFNEKQGPVQALRHGDWKLLRFHGRNPELYCLADDIGERNDVAAAHPELVARLTAMLDSARTDHPAFPLVPNERMLEELAKAKRENHAAQ